MHSSNAYWAILASDDPKKDGKEIEVVAGSKLKGCQFYDIEPMHEFVHPNEYFWYMRIFATKVIDNSKES